MFVFDFLSISKRGFVFVFFSNSMCSFVLLFFYLQNHSKIAFSSNGRLIAKSKTILELVERPKRNKRKHTCKVKNGFLCRKTFHKHAQTSFALFDLWIVSRPVLGMGLGWSAMRSCPSANRASWRTRDNLQDHGSIMWLQMALYILL